MNAGAEVSLRIGQRVRHTDYKGQRVTGIVRGLTVEPEEGLMVQCALDAPIVIPAGHGFDEISIWHQNAQAHEFQPFDERDEIMAEMLAVLVAIVEADEIATDQLRAIGLPPEIDEAMSSLTNRAKAAIAKASGSAA